MTLAMPDSTNVNQLPVGYDAYLGYADGEFPTAAALERMFPGANLVILTVTGGTTSAHGALVVNGTDTEPGDLNAAAAVRWASGQMTAGRPVIYASVEGKPGYGMKDVRDALAAAGIPRTSVRLLSAHYGFGPHICGPHSCDLSDIDMDGTQWTDSFATGSGAVIDMSMLADDFFGPAQSETERLMQELGIVQRGMTGAAVKTVQALCLARVQNVIGPALKIDGVFGPETVAWVKAAQSGKVTMDGVVGPQTWPVLLGVA